MPPTDETKPRTILSIDDDPLMIGLFRLILEPEGYQMHAASGGREGLALMRKLMPDLILLDIMMPDMDGWEVYETMLAAELTYKIPVIVVSAKPQPDPNRDVIYTFTRPADYLVKPFEPARLIEAVRKVLG